MAERNQMQQSQSIGRRVGQQPAIGRTNYKGINDGDGRGSQRPGRNGEPSVHGQSSFNKILAGLPATSIKRLRPHMREISVAKDDYLYQVDEPVKSVHFPLTSVISKFQILEDGRTIEVALVGNESAVGLPAAFGSYGAVNCSQVCARGAMIKIDSEALGDELARDPWVAQKVHDAVAAQMRQLSQKVICNTFHTVEQRFCTWLLELQARSRMPGLRVTHEHIARVLGVHRPSVTCIAQHLREMGLIDYSRGLIIIRDRKGLEDSACICSREMGLEMSASPAQVF